MISLEKESESYGMKFGTVFHTGVRFAGIVLKKSDIYIRFIDPLLANNSFELFFMSYLQFSVYYWTPMF